MNEQIIFSMERVSKIIPPSRQILKNIYLSFFYGAKIGVLGLNGSGKSTLLRVIAGIDKNINGDVVFSPGYTVGMLEQEPTLDPTKTVRQIVEEGVQEIVDLLKEFDTINEAFGDPDADFDKLLAVKPITAVTCCIKLIFGDTDPGRSVKLIEGEPGNILELNDNIFPKPAIRLSVRADCVATFVFVTCKLLVVVL
jgi:energy-coupling factor transporter ATP-binding protein EcfA2